MYEDHFRLAATPFSIAPDPRFLYMSARHREAIAHLLFGVRGEGGFVLLTGEVGTGKTTLCRCLLEQIPELCDVAFILNPKLGVRDLLATICEEFHVRLPAGNIGIKQLIDALNQHLLRANAAVRRALLIIDEAQNLQPEVIELLRLLTNLETNTRKLLQIVLIGQPELKDILARPEMRQVAQRVVARFHLTELTRDEVAAYVKHRLRVAGSVAPLIPDKLMGRLYRHTNGVPRLINLVCDRALLGAYVQGKQQVTRATLDKAAGEVFGIAPRPQRWRRRMAMSILAAGCAVFLGGYVARPQWFGILPELAAPMLAVAAPSPSVPIAKPAKPASSGPAATITASSGPAAPAVPAEPALAANLDWPATGIARERSQSLAFHDLFKLYGIDYQPHTGNVPCKAAAAANLRCLVGRGGLADLLRFNQPAVLTLGGGNQPRYFALLTKLDQRSATLVLGGETRRVSLADISPPWSGDYVLLWQPPPGGRDTLTAGSSGPAVAWLRQRLGSNGGDGAAGPATFDDDLVRRVKAFQLAEGIIPDGVAGALTFIRLDLRLDKNLPRLSLNEDAYAHVIHP